MSNVPTYNEVWDWARKYNKILLATDSRFRRYVEIIADDGSLFLLDASFLVKYGGCWIVTFSEHYHPQVFYEDALLEYKQFEPIYEVEEFNV